jgi:hypothetical protein
MVNFDLLIFLTEEVTTNWPSAIETNPGAFIISVVIGVSMAGVLGRFFIG